MRAGEPAGEMPLSAVLRLLGLMLVVAGGIVVFLGVRRLPESLPAGTPAEIVHVADFALDPPRSSYLHVIGGTYLPYASLALAEGAAEPAFMLVPLVDPDNRLLSKMLREAEATYGGDDEALERWNAYVASRISLESVQVMVLTTDVQRWIDERSVAVQSRYVEGVVRVAGDALASEILALLDAQFADVASHRLRILYEGEVPPAEESLRLAILLGGLAAVLGLAMLAASVLARRPRWLG